MDHPSDPESSEPTATATKTGTRLRSGDVLSGRFRILRFLAHGGMGEVYEAVDSHLQDQHHALKTLRPDVADKAGFRERFEREVLLARDVNHPNVCPTYDLFHVKDAAGPLTFLTMKLLEGESLQTRLRRLGRIPPDETLAIARQMAAGLDAAHRRGVVHRDFKPGNVMLEGTGSATHVWITDFGLSRAIASDATLAEPGQVLGTPGYIAPEVLSGETASTRADVYAFGVVLHMMLTGRRPVPDGASVMPVSQLAADVPVAWDRVIAGCLESNPDKRPATAGDALALLDAIPEPASRRPPVSSRVWAIAATALAVVAASAWLARGWIDNLVHPLPAKRFVALLAWPAGGANAAIVNRTIDAIGSRLARAESTTRDLVVIAPGDVTGQAVIKSPADAATQLGANLVLTASIASEGDDLRLKLSVLGAANQAPIRERSLLIRADALGRIEDLAATSAAELLDVPLPAQHWKDEDELAGVPVQVFRQFMAAEELARQPNDTGLDRAIEQYQRAIEAAPAFALAYGRLSLAYSRKYAATKEPAVLTLAERNADAAMRLNKDSVNAVLGRATVDLYAGRSTEALEVLQRALTLDPGNPQILLAKARAFRALKREDDEEQVYRDVIHSRPNAWPAYADLGLNLFRRAKYQDAAKTFQEGLAIAPNVVQLLNNLGAMQILLKQRTEAAETFRRSVAVTPTARAYLNLGNLAFIARDYQQALADYVKSSALSPKDDVSWRNIGDAYAVLGDSAHVAESYQKAASLLTESLNANPTRGDAWMSLAMYEAKLGHREASEAALAKADALKATSMPAQFKRVQTLALLGRREQAVTLLVDLVHRGQSLEDVDLAVDLADVRKDPRYLAAAADAAKKSENR